jgi:hypothetical protein
MQWLISLNVYITANRMPLYLALCYKITGLIAARELVRRSDPGAVLELGVYCEGLIFYLIDTQPWPCALSTFLTKRV